MSSNLRLTLVSLGQRNAQEGAMLLINKPHGWTSFDVIKKLRIIGQVSKIGHAGTLDPLATGLLVVCTGKKTKTISYYQDLEKVYQGVLVLGKTTPSIDLETNFDSETTFAHITEAATHQLAASFIGHINQVPPAYSAIKTQGVRSYTQARHGKAVVISAKKVWIKKFAITEIHMPRVSFEVTCGKGTYIRSLVRDFGQQLGTGAYLADLCRTRIGPYRLEDAYEIAHL